MWKRLLAVLLACLIYALNAMWWAKIGWDQGVDNPQWDEWVAWINPEDCSINLMTENGNWFIYPWEYQYNPMYEDQGGDDCVG